MVSPEPVRNPYPRNPYGVPGTVESIEAVETFARENGLGRYTIDEQAANPFPGSKSTAREWGSLIHLRDGQIVLDPHPWPTS
jgi:hypothetical protein